VQLGHTDTDDTTCLHVPEVGLVVAGDAVYNDVHQYFRESSPQGRRDWLAALDTGAARSVKVVVQPPKLTGLSDAHLRARHVAALRLCRIQARA
jgi:glyoxylase-like metal-dependent hydrolase (beta-lactamase superfamily II)